MRLRPQGPKDPSIWETDFPGGSVVKITPANAGDTGDPGLIPGSGSFPWRRKWQLTPLFLLEDPMDGGAWWATVLGVAGLRHNLATGQQQSPEQSRQPLFIWGLMGPLSYVLAKEQLKRKGC